MGMREKEARSWEEGERRENEARSWEEEHRGRQSERHEKTDGGGVAKRFFY
jgi:hypothetical protein